MSQRIRLQLDAKLAGSCGNQSLASCGICGEADERDDAKLRMEIFALHLLAGVFHQCSRKTFGAREASWRIESYH